MDRARGGNDYEDGRYMRDRAMDYMDRAGHNDYRRRGSNGRYMRDRADERYDDRRDYGEHGREHYMDDERDYRAYRESNDGRGHEPRLKIPREDMKRWGQMLMNADGTEGMHFDKRMLMERIKHMGGDMEGYTEDDLCMAANMLYSDYCEVLKPYISRDAEKEADFYLKMAKAFLEDEDAPDGSAKLAMYYFCIADVDE
jgi:hypothetical protein